MAHGSLFTAIEDPNTGVTLWESGAILQYLDEVYDKERKLNYTSLKERHQVNNWLHFQMSGQGPYYGQCGWYVSSSVDDLQLPTTQRSRTSYVLSKRKEKMAY